MVFVIGPGGGKHAETALKSLLSLPSAQLTALLKVAANLKPSLGKLLHGPMISAEEKDVLIAAEHDREKLFKELIASAGSSSS